MKLVLSLLLLIISGCSEGDVGSQKSGNTANSKSVAAVQSESSPQQGPEEVLLKYLDAQLKAGMSGRSKETYSLLSQKDKDSTSEDEYLSSAASSTPSVPQEVASALLEKIAHAMSMSFRPRGPRSFQLR